jgi:ubiquinone/menaquinone biosynthesis C-methylase UbiE
MKNQAINRDQSISKPLSHHFDQYMGQYVSFYDTLIKVINDLRLENNPLILDLGCGSGILLERIQQFISDVFVVGLDQVVEMLQLSKQRILGNHVNKSFLILGTADTIPLKSGIVEVVISRFSVCYWVNLKKSLQEIHRVLKSDGYVVFEMLNKDFSKFKLFLMKMKMRFHKAPLDVIAYHAEAYRLAYSREEIIKILREESFEIMKTFGKKNEWKYIIVAQKRIMR